MLGFRRGYSCAELIIVMRALVEGNIEWGETVMLFFYDSVRHGAILASMRRRQVPEALAAALRYLRQTVLTFVHRI